jgi:hypothetical protein
LWLKKLNGKYPLMPSSPTSNSERWATVPLDEFWRDQQEFALIERLLTVLRYEKEPEQGLREMFMSAVCFPIAVRKGQRRLCSWPILGRLRQPFGIDPLPPSREGEDYWSAVQNQLLAKIESEKHDFIRNRAVNVIDYIVNKRLSRVSPALGFDQGGFSSSWNSETLLDALYVMLFLDAEYGRRIIRCDGCGILFAESKKNVTHCSDRCGNRVRVRRTARGESTPDSER